MKRAIIREPLIDTPARMPPVREYAIPPGDGQIAVEPPPRDDRNKAYHVPTPYTRRQAEMLVAYGLRQPEIAAVIGVSEDTLKKHYEHELEYGKAKATAIAAHRLFDIATRGEGRESVTALIFWLKTRAGWSESMGTLDVNHRGTVQHEHTALSHEDRAARLLQVFAAGSAGGARQDLAERLRALVAQSRPPDDGVLQLS